MVRILQWAIRQRHGMWRSDLRVTFKFLAALYKHQPLPTSESFRSLRPIAMSSFDTNATLPECSAEELLQMLGSQAELFANQETLRDIEAALNCSDGMSSSLSECSTDEQTSSRHVIV
jgi:hypothetical protein